MVVAAAVAAAETPQHVRHAGNVHPTTSVHACASVQSNIAACTVAAGPRRATADNRPLMSAGRWQGCLRDSRAGCARHAGMHACTADVCGRSMAGPGRAPPQPLLLVLVLRARAWCRAVGRRSTMQLVDAPVMDTCLYAVAVGVSDPVLKAAGLETLKTFTNFSSNGCVDQHLRIASTDTAPGTIADRIINDDVRRYFRCQQKPSDCECRCDPPSPSLLQAMKLTPFMTVPDMTCGKHGNYADYTKECCQLTCDKTTSSTTSTSTSTSTTTTTKSSTTTSSSSSEHCPCEMCVANDVADFCDGHVGNPSFEDPVPNWRPHDPTWSPGTAGKQRHYLYVQTARAYPRRTAPGRQMLARGWEREGRRE